MQNETSDQPLWVTDHKSWERLLMAIKTVNWEIENPSEQIRITEELFERKVDKSNLSHAHGLASLMLEEGDCLGA